MNWKHFLKIVLLGVILFTSGRLIADEQPPMIISAGKGGFSLSSPDGDFVIKIRGYLQSDARFFLQEQPSAIDTFTLRRVRPIFEGTVYKIFEFRIMPDFGNGVTVLQDAYLDTKFHPAVKLRFGKAKTPFGLERLQSGTDLAVVERSFATNLAPNRDLGIQVFGDLFTNKVNYSVAVMNGVVDGGSADGDSGQSKDLVARFFAFPVKSLGVGLAYSTGSQQGTATVPNYVLTGEPASYKAVSPEHPFDLEAGSFGAFEVVFRFSELNVDDDVFPVFADPASSASKATNWTAGLNWYLNKNVKFVFNYDQTNFEGGNLKTEKLFVTRFQIAF